jgi:RHS repeat-associated protein
LADFARGELNGSKDAIADPEFSQSWAFDALGNWETLTTDGDPEERTHNTQNQLIELGSTPLDYDANGNLITDQHGKTLVWDAWDRLAAYKDGTTTLASYQHDALNRRIAVDDGSTRDLYYSAEWQVLEERVADEAQVQYVWSPIYVDALVLRDSGSGLEERLYVQQDANFNVTALLDDTGEVVERLVYAPYAQVTFLDAQWQTQSSSASDWIYLHQGGRRDETTGRYHFRYRDYDAAMGRWLQNDPIGFAGRDINLYRYLGNNPTNALDPQGTTAYGNVKYRCWVRVMFVGRITATGCCSCFAPGLDVPEIVLLDAMKAARTPCCFKSIGVGILAGRQAADMADCMVKAITAFLDALGLTSTGVTCECT